MSKKLKEKLADLAHEQWSGWMKYLFSKCIQYKAGKVQAEDGAVIIPKWAVDRWRKQMNTPYCDLSDSEQDSDRTEADKFLEVFNEALAEHEKNDLAKSHCLHILAKCTADLWHAIAGGMYDARSFVGDTVLPMQETLLEIGIDVREKPLVTFPIHPKTSPWVSVTERLPVGIKDERTPYLIKTDDYYGVALWREYDSGWDWESDCGWVVKWMPIPE